MLEVGAGQGGLGSWLARRYTYVGFEPDTASRAVAIDRIARTGLGNIVDHLDDPPEVYDLVCAFEVLEHIEDDDAAIEEWHGYIAAQGWLLLSTPAHSNRYGISDEYVGHFRRYDRWTLVNLLEKHGFDIVRFRSYGAGLGQALEAARNVALRRRAAPSAPAGSAGSGRLFQPSGDAWAWMNFGATLPFRAVQAPFSRTDIGSGYVVAAQRRS